ncbi:EpsG family protein [Vibrio vulnificus]|uniref:EpsG family protein n=1 Tax=Vibrio vulnificus TaxID=672 RepID=UPI001EEAADC8|nr:EpsG family protein [Vibrio vulnificus]MCG6275301.1 EpsG family protein [Vibrio vulnificus]
MIYTLIFLYLLIGSFYFDLFGQGRKSSNALSIKFIYFVLFLVAALRYRLAPDSVAYDYYVRVEVVEFYQLSLEYLFGQRFQPIWVLISALAKSLGGYLFLQAFISFLVLYTVFKFVKRYTAYTHFATLVFYIVFYHYFTMEILRESLAICLFLWAVMYSHKSHVVAFALIATCFFVHKFAVVSFPLYMIIYLRMNVKSVIAASGSLVLLMFVLKDPIQMIQYYYSAIMTVNFSNYEVLEGMSTAGYAYNLLKVIFPTIVVIYAIRRFNVMEGMKEEKQYFISFSIVFMALVLIRITSLPFIERFMNYMIMFVIVLSTETFVKFMRTQKLLIRGTLGMVYLFCLTVFSILPMLKSQGDAEVPVYVRYYPYSSYFTKETEPKREYLIRYEAKEL